MKKQLHFISYVASLALLGLTSDGPVYGQQTSPDASQPPSSQSQPRPKAQTPSQAASQRTDQNGQTFTGIVVRQGDKYVLQADDGTVYNMDHQDAVKKYEGKKVRVQGTLDSTGKMIYLQ